MAQLEGDGKPENELDNRRRPMAMTGQTSKQARGRRTRMTGLRETRQVNERILKKMASRRLVIVINDKHPEPCDRSSVRSRLLSYLTCPLSPLPRCLVATGLPARAVDIVVCGPSTLLILPVVAPATIE
jgi:hypothetical protein